MKTKRFCPICGEETFSYMGHYRKDVLCRKHRDMLANGQLVQKEDGTFVEKKNDSALKKEKVEIKGKTEEARTATGKCIACGRETQNGNLFCLSCYHKYKDKQILVQINKCREIKILDESYEGKYTCKDGHVVKSKSEREIDDYLFEHGIAHAYEKALPIDANASHDLHPDFFLPKFGPEKKDIYIEHWGFNDNNRDYTESKKYKMDKYKTLRITLVSTNEDDMKDPQVSLDRKLKYFKYGQINFDE